MSAPSILTLTHSGGTWTTTRYQVLAETSDADQALYRPPFGTTWFTVGDGEWLPVGFSIKIALRDSDTGALQTKRDAFLAVLDTVTNVQDGTRQRAVQGIQGYTEAPALLGYDYTVRFLPTGHGWTAVP